MKQDENVVLRLKRHLAQARKLGFKVRIEPLEDEQAGWCEIGGTRILFIDLSQTAAEQLAQVEETLASFQETISQASPKKPVESRKQAA